MPSTDFSIAPQDFVQFGWNGWSDSQRSELEQAVRRIAGVTGTAHAGGNSSVHVSYDRKVITQAALIDAVAAEAGRIVPGSVKD